MPKILNLSIELSDTEFENFMLRFTDGSRPVTATVADVSTAPTAPAAPTGAPELDSAGVPWLATVHAGTKSKKADGTWTGLKGVSKEARAQAEAPYRATAPAAPTAPVGMPTLPGFPAPAPAPVSYDDITAKFGALSAAGKITNDQMIAAYAAIGCTDVSALMTNETMRANLMAELNKFG